MVKPVVNLDDVVFDDVEESGVETSRRRAPIIDRIGASNLGYNLSILPPGKVRRPSPCHHWER